MTESPGDSHRSGLNILHEHLGLSKVRARWAPCFLTPVQKSFRVETCSELLAIYTATPYNVLSRIITGDETWIHHWDPDTKQESMQWKHVNSPPPRKFRTQRRLESYGHNFLGLQRRAADGLSTTEDTNDWILLLLTNLRHAVKEKRRGILTRSPLLLHGNAPAHTSRVAAAQTRCP